MKQTRILFPSFSLQWTRITLSEIVECFSLFTFAPTTNVKRMENDSSGICARITGYFSLGISAEHFFLLFSFCCCLCSWSLIIIIVVWLFSNNSFANREQHPKEMFHQNAHRENVFSSVIHLCVVDLLRSTIGFMASNSILKRISLIALHAFRIM